MRVFGNILAILCYSTLHPSSALGYVCWSTLVRRRERDIAELIPLELRSLCNEIVAKAVNIARLFMNCGR